MTSLVSLAVKQLIAPNWWNQPTTPYITTEQKLINSEEKRKQIRAALKLAGKPISIRDTSEMTGITIGALNNLLLLDIERGIIIKRVIIGLAHLELA